MAPKASNKYGMCTQVPQIN